MTVVMVKSLNRLGIALGAPVHPNHAWMEKRNHLQIRQSPEENLVRGPVFGVCLGRGAVETVGSPQGILELQTVATGADKRDFAEVNVRKQSSNPETRRMAALYSTLNGTLDNRVLLRLPRGRVLTANSGRVAVVHIVAADELPAVISLKAVWSPYSVHIGERLLEARGGLRRSPHTVWPHQPRSAVHEHDEIHRPAQECLVRVGQIDMEGLYGPPCARCRPPRCTNTYPLSLQAATTRLQPTRQGNPMLLSRLPQKAFVLVAGVIVKVINVDQLLELP